MYMKKILSGLSSLIFLIIFSLFYAQEYIDFHKNNSQNQAYLELLEQQKNNFQLTDIPLLENIEVFQMPDKNLLDQIVTEINSAETKVYLETYILTEKRIQEALKKAFNRWVDVKVLMEKNPYKAYNINNKAFYNLEKSWIIAQWSDSNDFSLNHSKFIIIDDFAYISTGNFSYSTFTKNRDYYIKISDTEIITYLNNIFQADYSWEKKNFFHPNIVLSPYNSRDVFSKIIQSAENTLDIYAQYFSDEDVEFLLQESAKKWVKIRAIIRKSSDDEIDPSITTLQNAWVEIFTLSSPSMHSKMFLVDNSYLFLWSVNISSYSLDKNRELWLLIKNPQIIKKMSDFFEEDIQKIIGKK